MESQLLKGPLASWLKLDKQALVSSRLEATPWQDAFRYRAKDTALQIAYLLIDEKGELEEQRLSGLNQLLEKTPYLLGPGRDNDALFWEHIRRQLDLLARHKAIWQAIRRLSPPLVHKKAEELIRETLWPEPIRTLTKEHVRKAVLAAWLTYLRQTTGSCFATAPAILIQRFDPLAFFKDLSDLLETGQMKRVLAGKEYAVPLSLSSGNGELEKKMGTAAIPYGIELALHSVGSSCVPAEGEPTAKEWIRRSLLSALDLTEEDLRSEEHLAKIQMTPLLARQSAVYYQKPSERAQKVAEWKKKLAEACLTFRTLTECPLLRAWEYSLASFSDVKTEFGRWNLYIGLGLHPDEPGGIGALLYNEVNERLQKCQSEIGKIAREYEREAYSIQALEVMLQGATNDMRIHQLKGELTSLHLSVQALVERRQVLITQADGLVGLFKSLIEQYDQKLQEFFQELFDPSLTSEEKRLYDDSSAGFRLIYKHGRQDASQWTAIYTQEEYIDSLTDFFSRVESELVEKELASELTTRLIRWIREPEFLALALERSRQRGRRSPWDYISGGTLQTLLGAYYQKNEPFKEIAVIPKSAEELFGFFQKAPGKEPLLVHSPTHAFVLYPGSLKSPPKAPKSSLWNEEMQEHLAHRVSERFPEAQRALFLHLVRQGPPAKSNPQFRQNLIHACQSPFGELFVDSVLYENTPLLQTAQAEKALAQIASSLGLVISAKLPGSCYGAYDLFQTVKMAILQAQATAFSSVDWDLKIAEGLRALGFCPEPQLFADTNWSGWFFGFVLHPVTGQLELWRLSRTGMQGFPMSDWKEWLSPANTAPWVILSDSKEYLAVRAESVYI